MTNLKSAFNVIRNFLSAVGLTATFFALIWVTEKPPVEVKLPNLPARYLGNHNEPKKPLKPSTLPKAPRIPNPEFKSLHAPSTLPGVR